MISKKTIWDSEKIVTSEEKNSFNITSEKYGRFSSRFTQFNEIFPVRLNEKFVFYLILHKTQFKSLKYVN